MARYSGTVQLATAGEMMYKYPTPAQLRRLQGRGTPLELTTGGQRLLQGSVVDAAPPAVKPIVVDAAPPAVKPIHVNDRRLARRWKPI